MSDANLYDRAVVGDRAAVREIVTRHHSQLVAYGRANGWPDHVVQDAAQVAWMNFFRHVDTVRRGSREGLRNPERLRFWLITTLRNALRDEYRTASRQQKVAQRVAALGEVEAFVSTPDYLAGIELNEQRNAVRRAFDRLGQTCRELLSLLLVDPPLAYADIAETLNKPVGAIGPTRQRCIEQVKSLIAEAS